LASSLRGASRLKTLPQRVRFAVECDDIGLAEVAETDRLGLDVEGAAAGDDLPRAGGDPIDARGG
jgi:hypothetical protein